MIHLPTRLDPPPARYRSTHAAFKSLVRDALQTTRSYAATKDREALNRQSERLSSRLEGVKQALEMGSPSHASDPITVSGRGQKLTVTLAPTLLQALRQHFPGYAFPPLSWFHAQVMEEVRDLSREWHEALAPFACTGDFDGNGFPDAALLLQKQGSPWLLIAFHQTTMGAFRPHLVARPEVSYTRRRQLMTFLLPISKGEAWPPLDTASPPERRAAPPAPNDEDHLYLKYDGFQLGDADVPDEDYAEGGIIYYFSKGRCQGFEHD
jgi:hypothetical protein